MKDLSDYKEKAEKGKLACARTIIKLSKIIQANKYLGISSEKEEQQLSDLMDRLIEINKAEKGIEAACN